MDLELRPIVEDERPAFFRAISTGFGDIPRDEQLGPWGLDLEPDRTLAVFDDDEIVGTAGAYSFALTVPGGVQVPTAGVTVVTVRPTHRRRGLLVGMMDAQLDDVARRGEPLAALTASESLIYGRFGYGQATVVTRWELDTDFAALTSPPDTGGRLRLVDPAAAPALVGPVYDHAARARVGEVSRGPGWWTHLYDQRRARARDDRPFFTVVHEDHTGAVDGFARYSVEQHWPHGQAGHTLHAHEVVATRPDTETALWRYLLDVDLVATVATVDRPLDEQLRWRLVDPRRLRVTTTVDHLWVRVVDVGAALAARTYGADDALVLELVDGFRPANSGCWLVDGGPDGAACARTDREPDLTLSIADVGALYLGGVDATTLARARRVEERTSGAVTRADAFFASHPAPWCSTHF
ncbi:MAG TPA: GNAT family N-acetyltransferase [Acidimicrobiia bacterium]|nr:GNAT family N-acetyltransferase [Acidimicrobiia bacterium]